MSVPDQAVAAVLSQLALAADGTVLGLALAFIAVRSVLKFKATNSALHQIKEAPSVRVSDLRSVVSEHGDTNQSDDGKLVIVRGTVEGNWKSLRSDVFVGHDSGEKAVIVQRTQMVPFVIVEAGRWSRSEYVNVNIDGSSHPLQLETVHHHLQPVNATSYFPPGTFWSSVPCWAATRRKNPATREGYNCSWDLQLN